MLFNILTDEDLIKWGWPEDVWFHVDKHSSAHVYLRLQNASVCVKNKKIEIFFQSQTIILQCIYANSFLI